MAKATSIMDTAHKQSFPSFILWIGKIISTLFHPLLILSYSYILLAIIAPQEFGVSHGNLSDLFYVQPGSRGLIFFQIVMMSAVIPFISILLMRNLGMMKTIKLDGQNERKIPYVLIGAFYIGLVSNLMQLTAVPFMVKIFALGSTVALFLAFFVNLFTKISAHTTGAGALLGVSFLILLKGYRGFNGGAELIGAIFFIAGAIGTARMLRGKHKRADIYGGYMVGILGQMVAFMYMVSTLK